MMKYRAFEIASLIAAQQKSYEEFLRVPAMSMGIYHLKAGGVDGQSSHNEDEVYYVLKGRANLEVQGNNIPVNEGSIVFVAANVHHHFKDIAEDLTVLVFFAPAEQAVR